MIVKTADVVGGALASVVCVVAVVSDAAPSVESSNGSPLPQAPMMSAAVRATEMYVRFFML
jgi:hypothetical protein